MELPALPTAATLQVIAARPAAVTVDGGRSPTAGCWQSCRRPAPLVLGSRPAGDTREAVVRAHRKVVLSGVDKAAYQAEFADGAGTGTDANHSNYTGVGFVDHFDQAGDSVNFAVNADAARRLPAPLPLRKRGRQRRHRAPSTSTAASWGHSTCRRLWTGIAGGRRHWRRPEPGQAHNHDDLRAR